MYFLTHQKSSMQNLSNSTQRSTTNAKLFLLLAGMGLFYTTLTGTSTRHDKHADCNSGIELAYKELQQ